MLLDCPSCAASYDEDPARLLPGAHPVRCPRCHAAWHPEILFDTNAGNDDACRIAMLTAGVCAARLSVQANRKQGTRIAALDAIERIREQAHGALNAVRLRYREDHSRIVSLQATRAAVPTPHAADESLAEAAPLPFQSPPLDAGRDLKTRMRISRAFAEALADVYGDTAGSNEYADRLPDNEQPRPDNETGSLRRRSTMNSRRMADAAGLRSARLMSAHGSHRQPTNAMTGQSLLSPRATPMNEARNRKNCPPRSVPKWKIGLPHCGRPAIAVLRPRPPARAKIGGALFHSLSANGRRPKKRNARLQDCGRAKSASIALSSTVSLRPGKEKNLSGKRERPRNGQFAKSAPAPGVSANGWQNMWIALFITSAILLVLRAWFH